MDEKNPISDIETIFHNLPRASYFSKYDAYKQI